MRVSDNVRIVKDMFRALNEGNMTAVLNSFAEEVEWLIPGPAEVPYAGPRRGRDQVADCFAIISKTIDFTAYETRKFICQEDLVVVLGFEALRVKATGNSVEIQWAMAFTVHKGVITTFRMYWDTHAAYLAFRKS
jgi:uncharacterized protein